MTSPSAARKAGCASRASTKPTRPESPCFPRAAKSAAFAEQGIRRAIADDAPAHSLAIMTAPAAGQNPFEQNG